MDKIEHLKQQKQYEAYVKKKTPQHNVWFNMMKAFFLGGMICLIGQCIYHFCELKNLSPDDCSSWTSILLILLSILLTGTGIYPLLAKWGGAGALVPITGFANSKRPARHNSIQDHRSGNRENLTANTKQKKISVFR